jgi:preprotein translocase subunit SecD
MRPVARLSAALLIPLLVASCTSTPDVKGSTTVVLVATDASGVAAGGEALTQAQVVLAKRAQKFGLGEPTFAVLGEGRLKMTVPGRPEAAVIAGLAEPGHLLLRKVLDSVRNEPQLGPSPAATGTSSPSATSAAGGVTPAPTREAVLAKLGVAATAAANLTATDLQPATLAVLAPFDQLTPAEVAVLPSGMQLFVPHLTCATLSRRPSVATEDPKAQVVACDNTGSEKHLLDAAVLTGLDIASAKAAKDDNAGGRWVITIGFTDAAKPKWTTLTGEAAVNGGEKKCSPAAAPQGNCAVAIVLDGSEVSAPFIMSVITGDAQISGAFTEQTAKVLAAQLQGGSLSVRLRVESITAAD